MALEMWIRKVRRPTVDLSHVNTEEDLRTLGLQAVTEQGIKEDRYSDLLPYCIPVECKTTCVNLEEIKKDFGLLEITSRSHTSKGIKVKDIEGNTVFVSKEDVSNKYSRTENEILYVFEEDEVCFWRRALDIQHFIKNEYSGIMNCGYKMILPGTIDDINEIFDEDIYVDPLNDGEAFFYQEWY